MSVDPYIIELMNNGNITEVINLLHTSNDSTRRACCLIAATQDNLDIIKYLDPLSISKTSEILLIACANNSIKIVKNLPSILNIHDSAIFKCLEKASEKGYTEIFEFLHRKTIFDLSMNNNKLVQIGCINKNWNIVKYISLNTNEKLLTIAAKSNNVEMIKNIIDDNIIDEKYLRKDLEKDLGKAFEIAASDGNTEMLKILYSLGIQEFVLDVSVLEEALIIAIKNKDLKTIKFLTMLDDDDLILSIPELLSRIAKYTNPEINNYLFSLDGIDLHYALYVAAINDMLDLIKYLISLGANPGPPNDDEGDYSPLEGAAMYGNLNIVQYLIENYRDQVIMRKDNAIWLARQYGRTDVVNYLESI